MPDPSLVFYTKITDFIELSFKTKININHLLDVTIYRDLLKLAEIIYINNNCLFRELVIIAFLRYINLYSIPSIRNGESSNTYYKNCITENNNRFLSYILNQPDIYLIENNSNLNEEHIYKLLVNSCLIVHNNNAKELYKTLIYLIIPVKVFLFAETLGKKI